MTSLLASLRPSLHRRPHPAPLRRSSLRRSPPLLLLLSSPSPRLPRLSAVPGDGPPRDEWGEKAAPELEAISKPDPTLDDDEWGTDLPTAAPVVAPAEPDPLTDEDEWGREPAAAVTGGGEEYLSVNGSGPAAAVPDRLGELKQCLVDTLFGTELGLKTSAEVRGEILELVTQLEGENPTGSPTERPELLDGNWVLLYTAFSELLPLLAIGTIPLLKIKKISQEIDSKSMTIVNATTISSPFATFSFSATASFEVQSPSRIQVQFKEGSFQPPQISSTVDLPSNIDVAGQKINLSPIQQSLNPVQEAVASIARTISGQPPLKIAIPGNRGPPSWLLITYLDEDFRISRGDGGLFILAREGSPLIDQLS